MSPAAIHVGIDATSWANDRGFGRFTRELVIALAARDAGFHYTLVFDQAPIGAGDAGAEGEKERPTLDLPEGVGVMSAATGRTLNQSAVGTASRSPGYLWRMGQLVRRADFDLFFYPAVYSYFPLLARVPKVVCYHDATAERIPHLLFPTKLNHRLWQIKTALARLQTTRAMTVSASSARDVETILRIPADRIDLVTEAADPVFRKLDDPAIGAAARRRHGIPDDADLLVYVGGMNAHKNILGLLRAMPAIVAARPAAHLAIVGDTSGKGFWDNVPELMDFVAGTPPLSAHVHFTGYLADAGLVELLNGSDALVFPSLWEGFGLPAVEAMSCGVPVLASDRGSLPEVVGDAGRLFDPENAGSMAECVIGFLADHEARATLGKRALRRAAGFSWERAAELAEECFRRACADGGRG